jgi:glycosyltransferase involved in cell wall biosynthesis
MSNSLKIGIIGTRGIPNRYGGFETFAAQISPRLVARGHQVFVYCSHDQAYRQATINGVNLVFRYNPESLLGTAGQFIYDLNCNLHSRIHPFDVILHLGYTSDAVWTGLWSSRAKHLTNMDGMEWQRSKYASPVQSYLKKAEKRAAKGSDMLIADSTAILDYLESHYPTPARFISYGAEIPGSFDSTVQGRFVVDPYLYDLLIARAEPENNIEMAIEAKLGENSAVPLLIFSNETNFGIRMKGRYRHEKMIRFEQANYLEEVLNSLRHYSRYYIHGHSAGGTNPSLLEAMACGCRILAHDNRFNRSVLAGNAGFYKDALQLTDLLKQNWSVEEFLPQTQKNLEAIRTNHHWDFITDEYERAFYKAQEL